MATSTVHVRVAGLASTFPALSFPRTANVCCPLERPEYDFGEVHDPHAPVSRLHSNEPDSVDENENEADADVPVPLGPLVIEVSGALASIAQVQLAGVSSTVPAVLRARARNVCEPSASPL